MLKPVTEDQIVRGLEIARPEAGKALRVIRDPRHPGAYLEYRSLKTWMIRLVPIERVRIEIKRRKKAVIA